MCVYVNDYVYTCVCMHMNTCAFAFDYVSVGMFPEWVYTSVCVDECVYVCICEFMYVNVDVYLNVYVFYVHITNSLLCFQPHNSRNQAFLLK